jgi:hypothetical protein
MEVLKPLSDGINMMFATDQLRLLNIIITSVFAGYLLQLLNG